MLHSDLRPEFEICLYCFFVLHFLSLCHTDLIKTDLTCHVKLFSEFFIFLTVFLASIHSCSGLLDTILSHSYIKLHITVIFAKYTFIYVF